MSDAFDPGAYGQNVRVTLMGAAVEAQRRGLDIAEAEHLLLALAAESLSPAGRLLAEVGFDHPGVTTALRVERERSLQVAGVDPSAAAGLHATRLPPPRARWGASIREAIKRGAEDAKASGRRDRRAWRQTDLLIGLLLLDIGTVPRTFAYAGVDSDALLARARATAPGSTEADPAG
ncbi:MAG: Clp protease N-terminal domain-containing protein [Propionicimonas sp.]|nr:Clp protease N-terminal domain-containing protein [Propionicimonas sp.]